MPFYICICILDSSYFLGIISDGLFIVPTTDLVTGNKKHPNTAFNQA